MSSLSLSTNTDKISEWLAIYQAGSKAIEILNNPKDTQIVYSILPVTPKSLKSMLNVLICLKFMKVLPKP
jgi:hypothetical protein